MLYYSRILSLFSRQYNYSRPSAVLARNIVRQKFKVERAKWQHDNLSHYNVKTFFLAFSYKLDNKPYTLTVHIRLGDVSAISGDIRVGPVRQAVRSIGHLNGVRRSYRVGRKTCGNPYCVLTASNALQRKYMQ